MFKRLAATVIGGAALMMASSAYAVVFTSGSFAFGSFTSSTQNVTTATVFPLTGPVVVGSPVDDFALVPLPATLTLPAGAVDFNLVGCCNWTDPQLGTFVGTILPNRSQTTPHPNASATWDVVGTYTVGPAFSNAGAILSANMTWSLTQTGSPTDSTSISGTFHSPSVVPEPATLALMGLALAGLGVARRRKAN